MAEISAAVIGGGFALAAAGYSVSAGFSARHETAHAQQVDEMQRLTSKFEEVYKRQEVSQADWQHFLAIREQMEKKESEYDNSIEEYKVTPMYSFIRKWKRKKDVRKRKKEARRLHRGMREHYYESTSQSSDVSSITAESGSPPRRQRAYSGDDHERIGSWARDVADSDSDSDDQEIIVDEVELFDKESNSNSQKSDSGPAGQNMRDGPAAKNTSPQRGRSLYARHASTTSPSPSPSRLPPRSLSPDGDTGLHARHAGMPQNAGQHSNPLCGPGSNTGSRERLNPNSRTSLQRPQGEKQPRPYETTYGGRKKALLIDINHNGTFQALVTRKISRMNTFLIEHSGYTLEDIVVLVDDAPDKNKKPTRENMIRHMMELVQDAEKDDTLFFHVAGHGYVTPHPDDSGMGRAIYPIDYETSGPIVGDDLHNILVKPLPRGCRLIAMIDACHSGNILLDLPYTYDPRSDDIISKVDQKGIAKRAEADIICFSACSDSLYLGILSYIFRGSLSKIPEQTYKQLFRTIVEGTRNKLLPDPVMGASHKNEGTADFDYPLAGKPLKTWYKITGDLKSSTPLIVLHGGPGVGSSAYNPFVDLTNNHGIPIVQYDQVGCGHSTDLRNKASAGAEFWNDTLFVTELENLIAHLGLTEYDILGHSWGGFFGSRFAAKQPKGLRRLIIMSSAPSIKLWVDAQNALRKKLPQDVQETMTKCEKEGTTDSEEYQSAMGLYYSQFLCRLDPMPQEILDSLALLEGDPTVYGTMWGPSEFFVSGTLKDWTVLDELHKISVPTLLLNGRYDEAQDSAMLPFIVHLPKVKWVQFSESAHMAQFEERERFMHVVGTWLKDQ